jgi:hypothetical protein
MTIGMVKGELPDSTFQETNENEVNSRYKILKSVQYIKWFPQVDPLPILAIPGLDNCGAIATNCNAKMRR